MGYAALAFACASVARLYPVCHGRLQRVVAVTFNALSIDSDQSTSDTACPPPCLPAVLPPPIGHGRGTPVANRPPPVVKPRQSSRHAAVGTCAHALSVQVAIVSSQRQPLGADREAALQARRRPYGPWA